MVKQIYILSLGLLTQTLQTDVVNKIHEALNAYAYEPTCSEVVEKAINLVSKADKNSISSKKIIRASALLPSIWVHIGKNIDYDQNISLSEDNVSSLKIYTDDDLRFKISFYWNLSEIIFNPAELNAKAKAQAEAKWKLDLKKSIVEIYHMRKKFQILLFISGETASMENAIEWNSKLQELTSLLDALTENWFSEESKKRKQTIESRNLSRE